MTTDSNLRINGPRLWSSLMEMARKIVEGEAPPVPREAAKIAGRLSQQALDTQAPANGRRRFAADLLDQAYMTMAKHGPLGKEAEQFMYFETGQGSELTYGKHNGIDMTTTEALCYGLARRYDPFMVNNVTGFIGPETHRSNFEMIVSNLQDHFMGKLLGLPMGMAPCYTLHSEITMEGQQIAADARAQRITDALLPATRGLVPGDHRWTRGRLAWRSGGLRLHGGRLGG